MISDIEKLLINLGLENWIVQVVISFLISLMLLTSAIQFVKKVFIWMYKKYIEKKASKDLHPFFSRIEVESATENFVKTRFQNVPPSQDEEPGRNYISSAKQELIPLFRDLAFDESKDDDKYYIILADSGMGKTTFMINLFLEYKYGLRWPWVKRHDIKLYPLGNPNSLSEIEKIENKEGTILLLDAFDEDNMAVKDYSGRLNEIIKVTWNFRDVVITCRTQFFPDSKSEPYETGRLKFGPKGGVHRFKKLYISVFSPHDIKRYLSKKFNWLYFFRNKKYFKASAIVLLSPNLMIRPMLLSHIEDLVDRSANYKFSFQIYRTLIDEWLKRESKKPGILSRFENSTIYKRELYDFSITLARKIYEKNDERKRLGVAGIPDGEDGFVVRDSSLDIAEQTSRSLLNRNAVGEYKFSHKSVYEYFLAVIVLEDSEFRKKFFFEENLDTCRRFFNEIRCYDSLYMNIQISLEELKKINAIDDIQADSIDSSDNRKEHSKTLKAVSSSLKNEIIRRSALLGVITAMIFSLIGESIIQSSLNVIGIEFSRATSTLLGAFSFFGFILIYLIIKYGKVLSDIENNHKVIDEDK